METGNAFATPSTTQAYVLNNRLEEEYRTIDSRIKELSEASDLAHPVDDQWLPKAVLAGSFSMITGLFFLANLQQMRMTARLFGKMFGGGTASAAALRRQLTQFLFPALIGTAMLAATVALVRFTYIKIQRAYYPPKLPEAELSARQAEITQLKGRIKEYKEKADATDPFHVTPTTKAVRIVTKDSLENLVKVVRATYVKTAETILARSDRADHQELAGRVKDMDLEELAKIFGKQVFLASHPDRVLDPAEKAWRTEVFKNVKPRSRKDELKVFAQLAKYLKPTPEGEEPLLDSWGMALVDATIANEFRRISNQSDTRNFLGTTNARAIGTRIFLKSIKVPSFL